MIWFFLAGWISGAVFMVLYAKWWVRKHARIIDLSSDEEQADGQEEKEEE